MASFELVVGESLVRRMTLNALDYPVMATTTLADLPLVRGEA